MRRIIRREVQKLGPQCNTGVHGVVVEEEVLVACYYYYFLASRDVGQIPKAPLRLF